MQDWRSAHRWALEDRAFYFPALLLSQNCDWIKFCHYKLAALIAHFEDNRDRGRLARNYQAGMKDTKCTAAEADMEDKQEELEVLEDLFLDSWN